MLALAGRLPAGQPAGGQRLDVPGTLLVTTARAALGAMLMIGAVLAGYVYFVSLYLQKVLGFTPWRQDWPWSPQRSSSCSPPRCSPASC